MNRNRISSFTGLLLIGLLTLCVGCASLWRGTVTLTAAVDSAAKEYATLYASGLIPAETHARVAAAHKTYQQSAGVAHDALVAYKLSGDPTQYRQAFEAMRTAGLSFANLIVPFLTKAKSDALNRNIINATKL